MASSTRSAPRDAAGDALIASAALDGNVQNAKGTDHRRSTSTPAANWATGWAPAAARPWRSAPKRTREKFRQRGQLRLRRARSSPSTGIDPNTHNEGSRNVYAALRRAERADPEDPGRDRCAALRQVQRLRQHHQSEVRLPLPAEQDTCWCAVRTRPASVRRRCTRSTRPRPTPTRRIYDDPVNCPGGTADPGQVVGGELQPAIPDPDRRQHEPEAGKVEERHARPGVRADQQPDPRRRPVVRST